MRISSLLGCGLCTRVLSEALRYLLPGEGTAPATVSGAETTSQLQKVVLDPISGHDLSRHAHPVSAVYCKSDCDVGRESPQDYRGVSFIVFLGDSMTRGRRSFSPSARLELLLGRVRRQLGRPRRGNPSVRVLVSKPKKKGILHQPQGDDGSPGWLLRVQLSSQRQEDRSLLRLYHDSRLPQAIGSHEVLYTRRWSRTFFASAQRS